MLHPLEYVAMNALAGGTRGAYENFELDYWSAAASEALRRLEHRLDYDPSLRPAEAPPRILISRIAENAPRWPDMKKSTEDVGGPWGYAEFPEAIADPNHERHRELKEWFADDFNPHVLDVDWLAEDVAALAERWSRQPAVKRRRTA